MGSIQFSYASATPSNAVVGIAPGSAQAGTTLVSFHNDASAEYAAAVVERFGDTQAIDIVAAAQKFYETHEDAYDYLVFYNNMGIAAGAGALAFESTVRSSASGYGVPAADYGSQYGSAARLRSVMNMGRLDSYPLDANSVVLARAAAKDTPLTVLGHEAGHLFLAFASIPDPANPAARPMLGFQGVHWSFVFNSEASLDEGEQTHRPRRRAFRDGGGHAGLRAAGSIPDGLRRARRCSRHVRGAEPQRFSAAAIRRAVWPLPGID